MPRKAPKEVIEHRVTLGNFERDLLVKELADSKENKLYVAGITQAGQIAGSGVLLWAAAAYFGYNLLEGLKKNIWAFADPISDGLSNMWLQTFGGLTPQEANFISKATASLNERIAELNAKELVKETQLRAIQNGLINGSITFQEQLVLLEQLGPVPSAETIEERESIEQAKGKLATLKAELNESAFQNLIDGWPSFESDGIANLINAI